METLSLKKNHRDLCHDHTPRLWVNPFSFLLWIPVARLQDERRSRWWAGCFHFIGVPRDVIVLSVSIAPLVFPQIPVRWMAWVTMLECTAPVSRCRSVGCMKECQQVYIIVPWSINWYAPGKSYAIDGFCCDYKGHVLFSNATQTISWVQEHAVPYGSLEDVLFGMYGKHSKEWGTAILRLYPIGFSCFLLRNWCNSMLWSRDKELRHKCQYHNTVCTSSLQCVDYQDPFWHNIQKRWLSLIALHGPRLYLICL